MFIILILILMHLQKLININELEFDIFESIIFDLENVINQFNDEDYVRCNMAKLCAVSMNIICKRRKYI